MRCESCGVHKRSKTRLCISCSRKKTYKKIRQGYMQEPWATQVSFPREVHSKCYVEMECGKCAFVCRVRLDSLRSRVDKHGSFVCGKCKASTASGGVSRNKDLLKRNRVKNNRNLCAKLIRFLRKNNETISSLTCRYMGDASKNTLWKLLRNHGHADLFPSSTSSGEVDLAEFLGRESKNIIRNDRKILEGKEIDIVLLEFMIGVEYNGNIWHSSRFQKDKKYHFNKRLLAEEKGIRLIQIRSDEWLAKRPVVESLLETVLGKSEHRYFARKLEVSEVPGSLAQNFLQDNHLMGKYRSARHLGLFTPENELVQLFSYQLKKERTEMDCSRICSLRNHSIVGGVSRLLKNALRKHPSVEKVVSFVDLRYADGHSLEKIGFKRVGVTLGWGWTDGPNWFNRLKCKAISAKGITEKEHAALKGWFRIYDAGQAKYEMEVKITD